MGAATERQLEALYDQHFRDVLAYCLRRGPVTDAYDAANEVFAIAWRRIADIPSGTAARPWLFVVARRVLYRRRRSLRRYHNVRARLAAEHRPDPPQPETVVVRRAEYDAVLRAASRLSATDREILRLAAWEGLTHREISEMLGCSINAVDQRLHRAKRRLAKHYQAIYGINPAIEVVGGSGS